MTTIENPPAALAPWRKRLLSIALILATALVAGTFGYDRRIEQRRAALRTQLVVHRRHIEAITGIRRDVRKTYVGLLERQLAPTAEWPARGADVELRAAEVVRATEAFSAQPPSVPGEAPLLLELRTALASWSTGIDRALAAPQDAGARENLKERGAAIDRLAESILALNSGEAEGRGAAAEALARLEGRLRLASLAAIFAVAAVLLVWRARRLAAAQAAAAERARREQEEVNALLERRVAQRTQELATSNADLKDTLAQLDRTRGEIEDLNTHLREIYRTMPSGLVIFDRDGRIRAINETALALLEYSEDELVGAPVGSIFDRDEAPGFEEIEESSRRGSVLRVEKTCRSKTGTSIPVLFSAAVLPSTGASQQAPSAVVCVAVDIRDRKRLEIELRQAQKLESVGRLACGVAHEINTPVQFVGDNVRFLKDATADVARQVEAYRRLERAVRDGGTPEEAARQAAQVEREIELDYILEQVPQAIGSALEGLDRVATIVRSLKDFAHPDRRR